MTGRVDDDDLHAYVDGVLAHDRRIEVAAWLLEHPEDGQRQHAWLRQNQELHRLFDGVLEEPIPERLTLTALSVHRSVIPVWAKQVAAGLALLVFGMAAGWWLHALSGLPLGRQSASLADDAFSAHVIFTAEVRHPVEVPATERAHLIAWLSKRLGSSLTVPDLSVSGFALMGGRLLPASDGAAAQFMYENTAGQRLTLYVRHNASGADTAFRFAAQGTAEAFYWLDGRFGYALVGALPRDQLMPLARAVYQQLDAASAGEKPGKGS